MARHAFMVAATVLLLCLTAAARAADWKYVVPPPGDPFEHPPLRALPLVDTKPADLQEKVTYRGTRQQYGCLHLGSPNSLEIAVIVDRASPTEIDLYLDADRNRVIEPQERVTGEGGTWRTRLDVLILDGEKKRPIPRSVIFERSTLGRMLRFAVCGFMEGAVSIGDRQCALRRTDGDGNGLLADPQDRLWIDLDGNGQWDGLEEQFLYAPILVLGGKRYAIHADELGERLSLNELQGTGSVKLALTPDLAERCAEVTATLVGRDGFVLSLQKSAGAASVPVGEYRLSAVTIGVGSPAAGAPLNYVFSDSDRRKEAVWHRVERDGVLTLDPIGKLGLEAYVAEPEAGIRPGEELSVQPCFHTGDGLVIATVYRGESVSEEGRQSVSGYVSLMKADGTVLSSGTTGFG